MLEISEFGNKFEIQVFDDGILIIDNQNVIVIKYIVDGIVVYIKQYKKQEYLEMLRENLAVNLAQQFQEQYIYVDVDFLKKKLSGDILERLLNGKKVLLGKFRKEKPYRRPEIIRILIEVKGVSGEGRMIEDIG